MTETLALHGGTPVRNKPWPAWPEYGDQERAALSRVLDSRNWGGHPSPNTEARALNQEWATYVGARHAVGVANGTVSLQLALQAARVKPGAEVITTVYTFVATAGATVAAGCVPVFVDVSPNNYCIDPDQVEAAITPRTEAIIPVHLACSMADMDRLTEIAKKHGLLLVEDCAHAHGARWRDKCAGTIGDFGSFSMQSSKLMTSGEGGMVTTNEDRYAHRLHSLINCGRKEPGFDGFPEQMLGHNLRMSEWQTAILREQLKRLPEQHERRAKNIALFETEITKVGGLSPLPRDERITRRTAYMVILRYDQEAFAGVPRDHALAAMHAERVPCYGRFYRPLIDDPLFARDPLTNHAARAHASAIWTGREFPVAAKAAYEESIWIPHQGFLGGEAEVHDLVAAFAKVKAGAAALREKPPAAPGGQR